MDNPVPPVYTSRCFLDRRFGRASATVEPDAGYLVERFQVDICHFLVAFLGGGALQSFSHVHWVFYWVGLPRIQLGNIYHVALMPSLITVYLYSGLVCDVVTLIMMVKKLWKSDGAN